MTFNQNSSLLKGHGIVKPKEVIKHQQQVYVDMVACRKHEKIDSLVNRYHDYFKFNGSILVAYKGDVIYENTIGYADFRTKEPLTKESGFQLASVSKQFTAMAIMLLKKQGKLDYDDDVRKYIPQWPYEDMTIRHLLNHTAGLQNYMWLLEHKWKNERVPYNHEVISMLIKHKLPLNFTPGRYFSYCNTGYVVLAYLVETISKEFFADFLKDNIFTPLGMNNSFAYSSVITRNNQDKIMGYNKRWRGFRVIPETIHDGCIGDKGIYSTAKDLYTWDQALYTEKLVSHEMLEEAFTKAELKNHKEVSYGFGFRIKEDEKEGKVIYHHGLWNGFRTSIIRFVSDSSSIILLNHTNSNAKHHLVNKIEEILFEDDEVSSKQILEAAIEPELVPY